MKKNILPLLLIAGAAVAFMAFRRRPRVTVTADMPIRQTAEEFEAERAAAPKVSVADVGIKLVSALFKPRTEQAKKAKEAQRTAVKRAVKSKTATRAQAKAVTKALSKPIRFAGFGDDVLV